MQTDNTQTDKQTRFMFYNIYISHKSVPLVDKSALSVKKGIFSVSKSAILGKKVTCQSTKVPCQSTKVPLLIKCPFWVECPSEDWPPCPSDHPSPLKTSIIHIVISDVLSIFLHICAPLGLALASSILASPH